MSNKTLDKYRTYGAKEIENIGYYKHIVPTGLKSISHICKIAKLTSMDVQTGTLIRTLTGHEKHLLAVDYSPDGKILASTSWDRTVRLWDTETGASLRTLEGHTSGGVVDVVFSPDGKTLLSAGIWDKRVRLWDVQTGASIRELKKHTHRVSSVAFSPDGKRYSRVEVGTIQCACGICRQTHIFGV